MKRGYETKPLKLTESECEKIGLGRLPKEHAPAIKKIIERKMEMLAEVSRNTTRKALVKSAVSGMLRRFAQRLPGTRERADVARIRRNNVEYGTVLPPNIEVLEKAHAAVDTALKAEGIKVKADFNHRWMLFAEALRHVEKPSHLVYGEDESE